MPHAALGIDLGTTHSVIAHLDAEGRPCTIPNAEGDLKTPSAVFFDDGEVVVGREALKAAEDEPDRVARWVKRDMGRELSRGKFAGRQFPPEVIQALVLGKLKADAELKVGRVEQAVITVPAYFDEPRRKATQDAGRLAGLDVLDIINEPTAAALCYGIEQQFLTGRGESRDRETVLVYDLGGGTFDATLMLIEGGKYRTLATAGDVFLGGIDWDQRLADFLGQEFAAEHGPELLSDPLALQMLLTQAEDAKHALTAREETTVRIAWSGMRSRIAVTRDKFCELTADLLERTRFTVRKVLRDAKTQWSGITRLLLVGGSSRMPAVHEMLERESGLPVDRSLSPDEAVAHGAAVYAGLLTRHASARIQGVSVRNVNSHDLGVVGVETASGRKRRHVMIPRNTQLPADSSGRFQTWEDDQPNVAVNIVEGGDTAGENATPIGCCVVSDLPPNLPKGTPVLVKFHYAANGRLTVKAALPGTDQEASVVVERAAGLSDADIANWRERIANGALFEHAQNGRSPKPEPRQKRRAAVPAEAVAVAAASAAPQSADQESGVRSQESGHATDNPPERPAAPETRVARGPSAPPLPETVRTDDAPRSAAAPPDLPSQKGSAPANTQAKTGSETNGRAKKKAKPRSEPAAAGTNPSRSNGEAAARAPAPSRNPKQTDQPDAAKKADARDAGKPDENKRDAAMPATPPPLAAAAAGPPPLKTTGKGPPEIVPQAVPVLAEDEEDDEHSMVSPQQVASVFAASLVLHLVVLLPLAFIWIAVQGPEPLLGILGSVPDPKPPELKVEKIEIENPEEVEKKEVPTQIVTDVVAKDNAVVDVDLDPPSAPALDPNASGAAPAGPNGPLHGRSMGARKALLARYGGTKESEDAVRRGLQWLARHQWGDGGWSFDHRVSRCNCGNPGSYKNDRMAATAFAVLCFLGAGHTISTGDFQPNVQKGLEFLLKGGKRTASGGDFRGNGNGRMYAQGLVAIALCEAVAMNEAERSAELKHSRATKEKPKISPRKRLQISRQLFTAAKGATYFIVNAQSSNGGWRYEPRQGGDTSVVGWQIQALASAHSAGIRIHPRVIAAASAYLDSVGNYQGAKYGYTSNKNLKPTTTSVGLLSRIYMGWKRSNIGIQNGTQYLSALGPSKTNMYFNYYATQVMHQFGGPQWKKWNEVMRDQLVDTQIKDKKLHACGSWDPTDPHRGPGGRLYQTCLCIMTLEVYYRHLPLYDQRNLDDGADSEGGFAKRSKKPPRKRKKGR